MKSVLIRDDNLCFFSEPDRVEEVYGFILESGLPINFSVIPNADASARTNSADFGVGTYEPFIPKAYQGRTECFAVGDNPGLIAILRGRPGVEILQHGFCHGGTPGNYEFEALDRERAAEKIREGATLLERAFGSVPTTFVAPQDKYSRASFLEITARFDIFSLGWINRSRLPATLLPRYFWMKARGTNTLRAGHATCVEHPGVIFSRFKDTDGEIARFNAYREAHTVTVLVLHHWEFFEGGRLNRTLHGKFKDTVNALRDSPDCKFNNFRDLVQPVP